MYNYVLIILPNNLVTNIKLAYVASVVVRVASRVIALQPAQSPVAATASSCESWMSSQIWSVQRRGGLQRGRRQEAGADDDRMSMPWVPDGRRHMCPKVPRRRLRMVVSIYTNMQYENNVSSVDV